MTLFRYDAKQRRLWIAQQRIHHGPIGCFLAAALAWKHPRWAILAACWGITDVRDIKIWFKLGSQVC
jgi:hypothetical protein